MAYPTGTFTFERDMPCDVARLWLLMTDPDAREKWGAPSDDHVLHVDAADVSEGGKDVHRCGPKDNPEYLVETRWYRLEDNASGCFTETIIAGGARLGASLVTYDLTENGATTRLEIAITTVSFMDDSLLGDVKDGWTSALDRLAGMIEKDAIHV